MAGCPSCGKQSPDDARFCNACGAELGTTAVREVRKTVTVLFANVTGSTALGERLDPESLRRAMARYFEAPTYMSRAHGGTVEKFIGGFGHGRLRRPDDPRGRRAARPVRCRRAPRLAHIPLRRARARLRVSLLLRTGVNTGEVVTGTEERLAATEERLAAGDAVNVAARLEQAAQLGGILIGEQTRRLARDAIEVERVEPLLLKGKAEPLASYRLLRVVEGASAFDGCSTLPSSDVDRSSRVFLQARLSMRVCNVRECARMPKLMYPARTRAALSVL